MCVLLGARPYVQIGGIYGCRALRAGAVGEEGDSYPWTIEAANLAKAELRDARAKLFDVTKKVVTLQTSNVERNEEVGSIRAELDRATS